MNAKEANQLAKTAKESAHKKQLDYILAVIETAAIKGNFSVYYDNSILESVRNELTQQGFKVGATNSHINEYSTQISWNDV